MTPSSQRLDQWLWHSRLIKSRSLAARLVGSGAVRVNRLKIARPGHHIKSGDVLSFMQADRLHVIEVLATAERRGPAREARLIYRDIAHPPRAPSSHGDQKEDA